MAIAASLRRGRDYVVSHRLRVLVFLGVLVCAGSVGVGAVVIHDGPRRFTIVVLPDTQYYVEKYPQVLVDQVGWILEERQRRNIAFVSHEGDIVEHFDDEVEWGRANEALSRLIGVVPLGLLPGNHDMSPEGGTSEFNRYFGADRFRRFSWYGGSYPPGKNDNSFQLFAAGGYDFGLFSIDADRYLILHMAFCPEPDVVDWADQVLRNHSDRHAILVTHAYLNTFGERHTRQPEFGCKDPTSNTQYLFDQLVFPHPSVFLVLSGHEFDIPRGLGESRRVDPNEAGQPVEQLLADFQSRSQGGEGWLRILTFDRKAGQVYVRTYSPTLGRYEQDQDSNFRFEYPN